MASLGKTRAAIDLPVTSLAWTSTFAAYVHLHISSESWHRSARNARSLPDIHPCSLTVIHLALISRIAAPAAVRSGLLCLRRERSLKTLWRKWAFRTGRSKAVTEQGSTTLHQSLEFRDRQRAAEQIALVGVTAQAGQEFALRLGLHAFGNDAQPHAGGHRDDGTCN